MLSEICYFILSLPNRLLSTFQQNKLWLPKVTSLLDETRQSSNRLATVQGFNTFHLVMASVLVSKIPVVNGGLCSNDVVSSLFHS